MDIQAYLGHANPATTVSVYSTPDFQQLVGLLQLPWHSESGINRNGDDSLLRALVPNTSIDAIAMKEID